MTVVRPQKDGFSWGKMPVNFSFINHMFYQMDDIQQDYREQLASITSLKVSNRAKALLLQNLIQHLRNLPDLTKNVEVYRSKGNYDVLSTSISECHSVNYQTEKDVEELEEKILRMRMVKFQNNEEIETMEEELFEMEKIVKARMEYHDFLKKKVDQKMLRIQHSDQKGEKDKQKEKSVLNKSLDAVAGVLKISKWWT